MDVKVDITRQASLQLERNFITTFQRLSRTGGTLTDDGVVVQYRSGHPIASYNVVLCADGNVPDIAEHMGAILDSYRKANIPMMWRVGALTENQEAVIALLEQNGLERLGGTTAMLLEKPNYTPPPPSSQLKIRFVDSEELVDDWLIPYAEAFGLDGANGKAALEQYRRFMLSLCNPDAGNYAHEAWCVGYCDRKPVSCANYLSDSGVIGLHKVGTLKEYRRRNFAKAIMEATIDHAWERFDEPIVLYASEAGRGMYTALGFVDLNSVERYELITKSDLTA